MACGIDIGSTSHFVAVPADRDDEPVREFAAFTADLQALVPWLCRCRITAVAMESTGVYGIPVYEMLDAAGFEVQWVGGSHRRTCRQVKFEIRPLTRLFPQKGKERRSGQGGALAAEYGGPVLA